MLRTRLWMGATLIALAVATLLLDRHFLPWYPFLFILVMAVAAGAAGELCHLLPAERRLPRWFCIGGILAILAANWPAHILSSFAGAAWELVLLAYALGVLAAFLLEMATFQVPGGSIGRIAVGVWMLTYLGILPSFLVQLRWLPEGSEAPWPRGNVALILAIFVPKVCDIGAYFTGRLLGRHPMAPVLSPKKTWEGFAGGLAAATLFTWIIGRQAAVFHNDWAAVGFGLTVGVAGVLGDLAESLVKRDCRHKDAGTLVPGFGGILDVVDSVIFAAPVAYWWLRG